MSLDESRLGGKRSLSSFDRGFKCSLDALSKGVIDALPVGRRTAVMGAGTAARTAPPLPPLALIRKGELVAGKTTDVVDCLSRPYKAPSLSSLVSATPSLALPSHKVVALAYNATQHARRHTIPRQCGACGPMHRRQRSDRDGCICGAGRARSPPSKKEPRRGASDPAQVAQVARNHQGVDE
jgi:hypothetical protein